MRDFAAENSAGAGHLLPPDNATRLEIALDLAIEAPALAVPVPLRDLWSPERCPAHLLDHLAWQLGVDLWDAAWSEGRRRRMCREIWRLKRIKGTRAAYDAYLTFVDATIVGARLPPQAVYALAADPARRAAYLERFAQIRVYPFQRREPLSAVGSEAAATRHLGVDTYIAPDRGPSLYGRRAVIWDKGVETPIARVAAGAAERFSIPAPGAQGAAFIGCFPGQAFAVAAPTARIVTVAAGESGGSSIPATAEGLAVVHSRPERISEPGTLSPAAARASGFVGGHAMPDDAQRRIYDRYHLLDRTRAPEATGLDGEAFIGACRISQQPFHAHFRIAHPQRARPGAAYVGGHIGAGHAQRPDDAHLPVAAALRAATTARDRVTFTCRTHDPLGFEHAPRLEDAPQFGDLVPTKRAA